MRLLGATVVPVASGTRTLKDAINEAIRDWVTNVRTTHYIIGSTVGPHPVPTIVRDFQSVIGREARAQILEAEGRLPTTWSPASAAGPTRWASSSAFRGRRRGRLHGVEAGGSRTGTRRPCREGRPGVLHGAYSYLLQDDDGQVSPGALDRRRARLPGRRPRAQPPQGHRTRRVPAATDEEALAAFQELARWRGILPARSQPTRWPSFAARSRAHRRRGATHRRQSFRPRRQGHRDHRGEAAMTRLRRTPRALRARGARRSSPS